MICSDFICTLAMSDEDLLTVICNTKLSESYDMTKYLVIYYYLVFKKYYKNMCCKIKDTMKWKGLFILFIFNSLLFSVSANSIFPDAKEI